MLGLKYLGENYWGQPVYVDQIGRWWLDLCLSEGVFELYKASSNNDEGEAEYPINQPYKILEPAPCKHQVDVYMQLSRLQEDCRTHLLQPSMFCSRKIPHQHRQAVIDEMKALWNLLEIKPEWLSWEEILEFEKQIIE